jgi:hypothetical protein
MALCQAASGQTLQFQVQQGSIVTPASDGATVTVASDGLGRQVQATVTVTYTGLTGAAVSDLRISGSTDFVLSSTPKLPVNLTTGQSLTYSVRFSPSASTRAIAMVSLQYTEGITARYALLNFVGTAPDLVVGYILSSDNNFNQLPNSGGYLAFPATGVNATSAVTVVIANRGSGAGTANSVFVTGNYFQLQGLPVLPASIDAGATLRFGLAYSPRQSGPATGTLQIYFPDHSVQVTLNASTATADFAVSYFLQSDGNSIALASGSTITFPATGVNASTLATVVITNRGTGGGYVNSVAVSGTGFQLAGVAAMPLFLDAGKELRFTLAYAPKQIGSATGALQIALADRTVSIGLQGSTASADLAVSYYLQTDGNVVALPSGGQLTFGATSIDGSATATLIVANRGNGAGMVNSAVVAGASFQIVSLPALPATLEVGKDLRFGIVFTPRQAGAQTGTLTIGLGDRTFVAQLSGSTAAPTFKVSYYFPTDGNVVVLDSGSTIGFAATKINATSSAVMAISNYGTGGGYVNSITLSGQDFQLTGMGTLPILVGAGKELRFGVSYAPTRLGTSNAVLTIAMESRTVTINLTGSSTGASFSYAMVNSGSENPFSAKETLQIPDTTLGQTTTLTMLVRNTGNTDGSIGTILVTGPGFQLSSLPIFPAVLSPNAVVLFALNFTPTQPGVAVGRLQIGADAFDLNANAVGPKLQYSYVGAAGSTAVPDTKAVLWGSVQVGKTAQIQFIIHNAGNSLATVSNASIVDAKSAFRLAKLPAFPATIASGADLSLTVIFAPTALGDNTARLRVDADTFTLVGAGTAPPSLPTVSLKSSTSTIDAMQQPSLGLSLASAYPVALTGTLTLTVSSSSFAIDPAVQFATGGRSVTFTIPANATSAVFPGGSDIRFQTGSVAGTITAKATFTTDGGIDVTPDPAPTIDLRIAEAAPRVLDIQLDSQTAGGFAIVITALSTTRSLTQLDLDLAASSKYDVPTGHFSVNLQSAATTWYLSGESQTYGSLFSLRIPFTYSGSSGSVSLADVIQSISATLTNEKGRSNSLSVTPH